MSPDFLEVISKAASRIAFEYFEKEFSESDLILVASFSKLKLKEDTSKMEKARQVYDHLETLGEKFTCASTSELFNTTSHQDLIFEGKLSEEAVREAIANKEGFIIHEWESVFRSSEDDEDLVDDVSNCSPSQIARFLLREGKKL